LSEATGRGPAAVNARMLELTRKFATRTTDDLAQMRAALARVGDGHDFDGSGLELIHQLAHRACGTGGTLGLHALSDAAGELERLIEAFPPRTTPGAAERARIAAGLEAIAGQLALL
jgi:HPt (histidine-containing phosphotransfer) domain-containing protein